jgi:hypothetical protein
MNIASEVIDTLNGMGLGFPAKPEFNIPGLPKDITELDDDGLMELFVEFTMWNDHIAGAHALAIVNEREAQRELDQAEASELLKNWTGTKTDRVAYVKAQIACDDRIKAIQHKLDTAYAFRKLLETKSLNVERDMQLVSRELTRRTSDIGGTRSRVRRFS